jgi:hypothetical protein
MLANAVRPHRTSRVSAVSAVETRWPCASSTKAPEEPPIEVVSRSVVINANLEMRIALVKDALNCALEQAWPFEGWN